VDESDYRSLQAKRGGVGFSEEDLAAAHEILGGKALPEDLVLFFRYFGRDHRPLFGYDYDMTLEGLRDAVTTAWDMERDHGPLFPEGAILLAQHQGYEVMYLTVDGVFVVAESGSEKPDCWRPAESFNAFVEQAVAKGPPRLFD